MTQQSAGGGRDQPRPSISANLQEACITEPKGARHCPGCSQPIERVDLAVFDAGDLFHEKCFVQGGGAYNRQVHAVVSPALRMPCELFRKGDGCA